MNHVYYPIGRVSALAEVCLNLIAKSEFDVADSALAEARTALCRGKALMNVAAELRGTGVPHQDKGAVASRRPVTSDREPESVCGPECNPKPGCPWDCPEPCDLDLEDMDVEDMDLEGLDPENMDLEAAFQAVFGSWLVAPAARSEEACCPRTSCEAPSAPERRASERRVPTPVPAPNPAPTVPAPPIPPAAPAPSGAPGRSASVPRAPVPRMPPPPKRAHPSQQAHRGSSPAHCSVELDAIAAAARSGNWTALVEQLSVAERVALTAALVGPNG